MAMDNLEEGTCCDLQVGQCWRRVTHLDHSKSRETGGVGWGGFPVSTVYGRSLPELADDFKRFPESLQRRAETHQRHIGPGAGVLEAAGGQELPAHSGGVLQGLALLAARVA